jgi:hypothetical protein
MNKNLEIEYLVGYLETGEFWAVFESDDRDEAFDFLIINQLEDADQDLEREWKLYKKTIQFTELA